MAATGTSTLRICGDGHANAIAVNRDFNHLAIAGRSRTYRNPMFISLSVWASLGHGLRKVADDTLHTPYMITLQTLYSAQSLFSRTRGIH